MLISFTIISLWAVCISNIWVTWLQVTGLQYFAKYHVIFLNLIKDRLIQILLLISKFKRINYLKVIKFRNFSPFSQFLTEILYPRKVSKPQNCKNKYFRRETSQNEIFFLYRILRYTKKGSSLKNLNFEHAWKFDWEMGNEVQLTDYLEMSKNSLNCSSCNFQ